ncbi:DUF3800 domain-containing protein [Longimicrobium terrae]|nr:DUF3800 domain-containing protein [Longimicrobium terrae]NNC27950.1 DUF3800 domain-containing protein [Longimicrobium terrae]
MPEFSDYIVFVDESGDHGLVSIDPSYPVFVLAFCVFEKEAYAAEVGPAVTRFKFRHFGHDQVILHEHEIRKSKGPFSFLLDAQRRPAFYDGLNTLMEDAPFTLIASVIDKNALRTRYQDARNPYHLGMSFGLERLHDHLRGLGCTTGLTHVLFERRGPKEDVEAELEFRRICDGHNTAGARLPFEIIMCDKKSNSAGLQLADLVARPVGRRIMDPAQPNRAYDILERKFRRAPDGQVQGWGLNVFP